MAPRCLGLCDKEVRRAKNPYSRGYKRCSTCDKFMKSGELRCYCCQTKFRKYSHKGACKKEMLESVARY